jgi:hypothetical protein
MLEDVRVRLMAEVDGPPNNDANALVEALPPLAKRPLRHRLRLIRQRPEPSSRRSWPMLTADRSRHDHMAPPVSELWSIRSLAKTDVSCGAAQWNLPAGVGLPVCGQGVVKRSLVAMGDHLASAATDTWWAQSWGGAAGHPAR